LHPALLQERGATYQLVIWKSGMKLKTIASAILDNTINILAVLAALLMAFLMLAVCGDVVMRYVFSRPLIWVTEVTEYSLLWITFLGAAWVLRKKGHVIMDLVLGQLKPGARTTANIFTSLIGSAVCLLVTWYGVKVTLDYFHRNLIMSTILSPPAYILFTVIPLGGLILSLQFLRMTYGFIKELKALTYPEHPEKGNQSDYEVS